MYARMIHYTAPGPPPPPPPPPNGGTCPTSCSCVNSSYVLCSGHTDIEELSVAKNYKIINLICVHERSRALITEALT